MKSQEATPLTCSAAPSGPKLLEQVRRVKRLHHYSIHTERSYSDWIRRFVHFHRMRRREDFAGGVAEWWAELKIEN